MLQLYIETKPYFILKHKKYRIKKTKEEEELDDIALCDYCFTPSNIKGYMNNNLNTFQSLQKLNTNKNGKSLRSSSTLCLEHNKNVNYMSESASNQKFYKLSNSPSLSNKKNYIIELRNQDNNNIKIYDNESEISDNKKVLIERPYFRSGNTNNINCIADSCCFSGGCFNFKYITSFNNDCINQTNEKSSICLLF